MSDESVVPRVASDASDAAPHSAADPQQTANELPVTGQYDDDDDDDDDQDDDDEASDEGVSLGFVAELNDTEDAGATVDADGVYGATHAFAAMNFPSKVGGWPVWLSPRHIPSPEQLECSHCKIPMTFLLQIYAPLDDVPYAYHRTLYVFVCRGVNCGGSGGADAAPAGSAVVAVADATADADADADAARRRAAAAAAAAAAARRAVRVIRCQLGSENEYYGSLDASFKRIENETANDADEGRMRHRQALLDPQPEAFGIRRCDVCGSAAPHTCARCHEATYCSRAHQRADWQRHKRTTCTGADVSSSGAAAAKAASGGKGKQRSAAAVAADAARALARRRTAALAAYGGTRLFREFELLQNAEPGSGERQGDEDQLLGRYAKYMASKNVSGEGGQVEGAGNDDDDEDDDVARTKELESALADRRGREFSIFEERIRRDPQQVLRYYKRAHDMSAHGTGDAAATLLRRALLVAPVAAADAAAPRHCAHCGALCRLEFQVMPQLLYYLRQDDQSGMDDAVSVDFSTILVFTCSASCAAGSDRCVTESSSPLLQLVS